MRANPDLYVRSYKQFGVEEAREIRARAAARALTGRRIFVVATPSMTNEAQNALLKTLEEPGDSIFFLVVPSPHALLATIRSRAHILAIARRESGGAHASAFLSASPEKRLAIIAPLIEKGDDDKRNMNDILDFLDSLERAIAASERVESAMGAIYRARRYIADTGALVKPLMEQLAFLLPVVKSRS